jgi:hypothetical protein
MIDTTTLASLKRTINLHLRPIRVKLVRHDWMVNGGQREFRIGMVRPIAKVTTTDLAFGFSDTGLCRISHMRWPKAKDYRCTGPNGFEVRLDGDLWMGYEFCTG